MRSLLLVCLLTGFAFAQDAAPPSEAPAPKKPKTDLVTLTFTSNPGGAAVYHGKKLLGNAPFSIKRRRDSGPVDVVYKLGGYLRVNARAYTWDDDKVRVQLTPVSQAHTLFGYKKPLEPLEDGEGDLDDEDAP